jgi:hypothetical protein
MKEEILMSISTAILIFTALNLRVIIKEYREVNRILKQMKKDNKL